MTRAARSLDTLLNQLNAYAPRRSRKSDGGIGDVAHRARRSDHNPVNGVFHARDFTDDPGGGLDALILREALRQSRDSRIRYVISEGQMFSSYPSGGVPAWTWRPYRGANAHRRHLHVSVWDRNGDDPRPWVLPGMTGAKKPPGEWATLRVGSRGASVRYLQQVLKDDWRSSITVDGEYGPQTAGYVKVFQRNVGLPATGIVDGATWTKLVSKRGTT